MITIVDYGVGNLASIANMLKKGGAQSLITSDPGALADAEKLILPGVGAFDAGMKHLAARKLIEPLNRAVLERRVPVIGLCLGMQLMTKRSTEGSETGLGWLDADTVRFRIDDPSVKVPHMGWNTMRFTHASPLADGLDDDARFYFVHSFHLVCRDRADILGETHYGYDFASSIERDNIMGVQFHPEKSHRFGLQLLRNFAAMRTAVAA
jgi:imidazole glycerol-phosphate synthase subunit HisH